MPAPRGLIFDKDGTLFDFEATWTAATLRLVDDLSEGDGVLRRAVAGAIRFDLEAERLLPGSVLVAGTARETAGALLAVLPGFWDLPRLLARMQRVAESARQVETVPLVPYFEALAAAGYRIGVVTNDSERPARHHLEQAGVTRFVEFVAGSDSGHGAKPGPGQLLAFCAATGLGPQDVVMIGDSRYDLIAGRAAGMRTIGVLTGLAPEEELAPLSDRVLPDIGGVPAWLDGL